MPDLDGHEEDDDLEIADDEGPNGLAAGATKPRFGFIRDPEEVKAREAYLRDWRHRMATFNVLQSEYMRRRRGTAGERLF